MGNLDTVAGVPIDCTGRFAGCERLPAALRATGLVERLGARDAGNLQVAIADPRRDPATGIIGFGDVVAASAVIRDGVLGLLRAGARPLVLGGCCTLLIGALAAAREQAGGVGLAFMDGHLDFYDGRSSPTGEAADMELAIVSGIGPEELTGIAGDPPLVRHADLVVLGARDAEEAAADGASEPLVSVYDPEAIREAGAARLGEDVAARFATEPGGFWLHLDLDVLDREALPAVDYPQPGGLSWEELSELAGPLAASPALVGADVTILNPTLDPDGHYARRAADLLVELFGTSTAPQHAPQHARETGAPG
jgi:arginase